MGIQEFYKGKTIFITGASGFMGKVLLEKLLYSCSDLKEILILMRPKRGKTADQRVQEFAQIPVTFECKFVITPTAINISRLALKVFHRIVNEKPEMFKKLVPVFGDITSENLGLSDEHYRRVTLSANIVYHMAASLKLEATLKPNVEMNLTGTKRVIDLCKQMSNLMAFIHLSTAFCNCDQDVMEEKVYDWPQKPNDLIRCSEWMTEEAMGLFIELVS